MHLILAYLKFLLRSENEHGVHSPFVFGLVTRCFYDKKDKPSYLTLRDIRSRLLQNDQWIIQEDLGAGSRVFPRKGRKISTMAREAGITSSRAKLLNRLTHYLDIRNALELGTSLGMGSAAIALNEGVRVTTVEGCPTTAAVAQDMFMAYELDQVDLIVGEFSEVLGNLPEKEKFGLVLIDGNHRRTATVDYFLRLLPHTHNDSVMIFDDIHWSSEMEQAWAEICAHPRVKVSIDTFRWGLVFFRREQHKEHFTIRL